MKRRIVMFLLVFLSFILQCTVLQAISIASISPNLLLVLTVSFALMRGKREGMFVGFISGLLTDLFFGRELGFYALLYTYTGFINGFCYRIFMMMISRCRLFLYVPVILLLIRLFICFSFCCGEELISSFILDVSSYRK